jgi:hypothetical protein
MTPETNTETPGLTQRDARHIVRKIGESGLPPSKGISHYNVGNSSLLRTLQDEYFEDFLKDGGGSFKLVVGDYGAGKSHFLMCVRDLAWRFGFVVSRTELSPKECPYDNQLAVYQSVARNIIWHTDDVTIEDDTGLDVFLENYFNQTCLKLEVPVPFDGGEIDPRLQGWLDSILQTRVESRSFQHAVYAFLSALARGDKAQRALLGSYLVGEPIPAKQTQAFNVNEKMDKANAFRMLRSLCQMLHELGHSGTVLLFDEGDRMVSIGSSKQEKIACDNLREVIDRCADGKLPGTLFVYAVPPRFVSDIAPKYPALSQRVGKRSDVFSRKNPFSTIISLEDLDLPGVELLRQIGARLLAIYEIAYEPRFTASLQSENISTLAEQCAALLSDHHRREFVKAWVNFLNEQRVEGERPYSEDSVVSEIRRVHEEIEGNSSASSEPARSKEY